MPNHVQMKLFCSENKWCLKPQYSDQVVGQTVKNQAKAAQRVMTPTFLRPQPMA